MSYKFVMDRIVADGASIAVRSPEQSVMPSRIFAKPPFAAASQPRHRATEEAGPRTRTSASSLPEPARKSHEVRTEAALDAGRGNVSSFGQTDRIPGAILPTVRFSCRSGMVVNASEALEHQEA